MELTYECSKCGAVGTLREVGGAASARCARCGHEHSIRPEAVGPDGLAACPWCATEDLYVQKDFPQGLGLAIVVVGFAVSTYFWYLDRPVPALGILLVSALVDMALYHLVPDVTICYRCLSQYRGAGSSPPGRFHPFDLAVGERYRQERLRIRELEKRATRSEPPPAAPS